MNFPWSASTGQGSSERVRLIVLGRVASPVHSDLGGPAPAYGTTDRERGMVQAEFGQPDPDAVSDPDRHFKKAG